MLRRLLTALIIPALGLALGAAAFAADYRIVPTIPLQGDHVRTARPTIAFQIHSGDATASVPQSAVRLFVDDVEETSQLAVEGADLAYVPTQPLAFGDHEVRVSVDDGSGGAVGYSWNFTIDADDLPPQSAVAPLENAPYGTLAPLAGEYGYGDDAGFLFSGVPGGSGYLTFAGFPGFYPLVPFYGNFYYAAFPVPWGYYSNAPGVVAHFYGPGGRWGTYQPSQPVVFVPQPGNPHRRYHEAAPSGFVGAPGPSFDRSSHPIAIRSGGPTIVQSTSVGTDGPRVLRFSSPTGNGTTTTTAAPTTNVTVPVTIHGYVQPGERAGVAPIGSSFAGARADGNGSQTLRTISPYARGTMTTVATPSTVQSTVVRPVVAPVVRSVAPVMRSAPTTFHASAPASSQSRSTR
jgi:hypothetical protein